MSDLHIYINLPWLSSASYVAKMRYNRLRGNAVYELSFADEWLRQNKHIQLGGDVHNISGWQYSSGRIFGFLTDALPDRWGRNLIDKRERMLAQREGRPVRTLSDYDYLLLLDDATRMGALRFKEEPSSPFLSVSADTPVPPLTSLGEFVAMANEFERADFTHSTLREQWVENLFRQGSSLGGARPKANMVDTEGSLYIAKVPSIHDTYDVALWEHFAYELAKAAGITVAQTRLLKLDKFPYHILLSRRFDRDGEKRVHFSSAMTLCNLQDGASALTGNGYLDIVDAIVGTYCFASPQETLCELYRRVAFNICIGNHDDHFRNHGFLLTQKGWTLSPAYDLNPTLSMEQSLLVSPDSNESSLQLLLASANYYMLTPKEASSIIEQVQRAVGQWRRVATKCHISKNEQERFAERLQRFAINE